MTVDTNKLKEISNTHLIKTFPLHLLLVANNSPSHSEMIKINKKYKLYIIITCQVACLA